MQNELLTPAQLAKISNSSKRTLLHYEDLGILRPKYVSKRGERFYTQDQLYEINVIKLLQSCNLGLQEIYNNLFELKFSYHNLFARFESHIQKALSLQINLYKSAKGDYSVDLDIFNRFNLKHVTTRVIYSVTINSDILSIFREIDKLCDHFLFLPANPIYYLEYNAKTQNTFEIGILYEPKLKPKAQYAHIYNLTKKQPHKMHSRISTLSRDDEIQYLNTLILSYKTVILLLHNRQKGQTDYLCETNIEL